MKKELAHPKDLWSLSTTYALFNFSYATIYTLIVLYAISYLKFSISESYELFAAFVSLNFAFTLPAGYIGEKFGFKRVVLYGLAITIISLLVMTLRIKFLLFVGIALFVIGYGFTTTAYFCLIGAIYKKNDPRRESGHTLFYLIFNAGSLFAIASAGFISQYMGFRAAFTIAAGVVLLGLLSLIYIYRHIRVIDIESIKPELDCSWLTTTAVILLVTLLGAAIITALLKFPYTNNALIWILMLVSVAASIFYAFKLPTKISRQKLISLMILILVGVAFWVMYNFEASLLTVFIAHNVDRTILGMTIPPSVFFSLDTIGVVCFGLILNQVWRRLASEGRDLSIPIKIALGICCGGLAFAALALGIYTTGPHLLNPLWIVLTYAFLTLGELLVAPIGISMVGKLSPPGKNGLMMGIYTLSWGFAAILTGTIATHITVPKTDTLSQSNFFYLHAYLIISVSAIIISIFAFIIGYYLKKIVDTPQEAS